jgi:hypothetical protein
MMATPRQSQVYKHREPPSFSGRPAGEPVELLLQEGKREENTETKFYPRMHTNVHE